MKKTLVIICAALILSTATAMLSGCGGGTSSTKQVEQTTEEAAASDLKVDKDGNVTDKNGKKLTVKDGKVTVEVDGKKVTVGKETIKKVQEIAKNTSKQETTSKPSTNGGNTSSEPTTSKPSTNNTSKPSNNNTSSEPTNSKPSTNNNTSSQPTTPKPTKPEKVWHEAEYEYINHPAETKQVWVVDKEAYTYEEPVYESKARAICNDCGADVTDDLSHCGEELLNGGKGSYSVRYIQIQTGTKTVTVPEEGHYETKVVKEAWTEKKLVRKAGYY
ncbi:MULTISPECIES: hypothetical protein [unclassified Ruminococcus]|uniref:hypothetical protein n=1 Tax=unclassified Ruminococcus TaxID=2608920 RepID=UPI002109837A|nr:MULTISPECIES: hypothetical protein [unclassified Ruminococcus]MCQ4021736.1 hypothetical protein [Ruminococcus sp. zg-924]MCQ4114180.1 hypothetical protein [Ruminococcus sp. zg-921]